MAVFLLPVSRRKGKNTPKTQVANKIEQCVVYTDMGVRGRQKERFYGKIYVNHRVFVKRK